MKKGIIIGGIVFLVLILGVVGWGLYNASGVKSYAKEIKLIMAESSQKWSQQKIEEQNYTAQELIKKMEIVQKDCENQLQKLNALKAPKKAVNLEKKTKEYFTVARDTSKEIIKVAEYGKVLEGVTKDLESLTGSSNSIEEFITLFTKFHKILSGILSDLRTATPPISAKEFHKEYITLIDKYDKIIVKAIGYAKNRDFEKLNVTTKELESLNKEFSKVKPPEKDRLIKEILTKDKRSLLEKYPAEIDAEANTLMKTLISF